MKFEAWNVRSYAEKDVTALQAAGYTPLTARVLSSRGCHTPEEAKAYLSGADVLPDPFQLKGMDAACARVQQAIAEKERIVVYGDYDVDGITATCLLADFLRSMGANCSIYIPGRIGEGYGLNETAIRSLAQQGTDLIVTVDCGITALPEAQLCRQLGIDLVITDHHECKQELPDAVAIVDPCRPDRTYPHADLCGVGLAFKLASAVWGNQEEILRRYADLICLGTIADVMPLQGENRTFVIRGLNALQPPQRVGLAALLHECGCEHQAITANTVGYILAPRINAAGRMGRVELATELFLTRDSHRAIILAASMCSLNRERQTIETQIYQQAQARMAGITAPKAIVLADEGWHQGVVGIVASRLAEDCGCPTFLICLDGDHGKASSRSFGGFNLFESLSELSGLLENFGGHELAAGFTIRRENIDAFREAVSQRAAAYAASDGVKNALDCDCVVTPELLTEQTILGLSQLEPCGSGCPRPVLCMEKLQIEQLSEVGGGKHLRLRLRTRSGAMLNAIFFSTNALRAAIGVGDVVDVAFTPQINDYRGMHMVQLNLTDIRLSDPMRSAVRREHRLYQKHRGQGVLSRTEADQLLPVRQEFVAVWRYLTAQNVGGMVREEASCLSRKIARYSRYPLSLSRTRICLDVFAEQGLITLTEFPHCLSITLHCPQQKVDLNQSMIIQTLSKQKAGDLNGNL